MRPISVCFLAFGTGTGTAMNFSDPVYKQEHGPITHVPRRAISERDGKSSAHSQLAHWDEDWTLIVDMTERRRIQNRIAQRNYRRRLKERLSRLEEHASRSEKSSNHEGHRNDKHDTSQHHHPSKPHIKHKDVPVRVVEATPASESSVSSTTSYHNPMSFSHEHPIAPSYSISSNASSIRSQPSTSGYTDFSTMFEEVMFDYPDGHIWRRATWPHE